MGDSSNRIDGLNFEQQEYQTFDSVGYYRPNQPLESSSEPIVAPREESSLWARLRQNFDDAALGIGNLFSSAMESNLLRHVATPLSRVTSALPRGLGGIWTLATSGNRVLSSYLDERSQGSENFPNTRKELVVSGASIGSGFLAGSVGGYALAGAAIAGAPAWALGALGVAGAFGVGYAAYKTRDYVSSWYDSIVGS